MKKTLVILSVLVALTFSCGAQAGISSTSLDSAGFNKLSESDKASIIQQVAKMSEAEAQTPSAQKVSEWVSVGEHIGKGLAGAAKETGVAVNEFAQTPVGVLTTVLLVWHFIGNMIVHVGAGILIAIGGLFTVRTAFGRAAREKIYDEKGDLVSIKEAEFTSEMTVGYIIAQAIVLAVAIITTFTY